MNVIDIIITAVLPTMRNQIAKFTWIERKRNFTFHHLHEPWTSWVNIFTIFHDFKWKVANSAKIMEIVH